MMKRKSYHSTSNMTVSIITVCFNSATTLDRTIQSVLSQNYHDIEYIIIDGGSTDGTLDIIKKYDDKIDYWISEPDDGIADAFNKGIHVATGEYIQLVNSDDWLSSGQIEIAIAGIEDFSADFVFGDIKIYNDCGEAVYKYVGDKNYLKKIHYRMPVLNHPTMLVRQNVYEQVGGFKKYRIAMDYEWLLRAHTNGVRGKYIEGLVGNMSLGGISDVDFKTSFKENLQIALKYGCNSFRAYGFYYMALLKAGVRVAFIKLFPYQVTHVVRRILNWRTYHKV